MKRKFADLLVMNSVNDTLLANSTPPEPINLSINRSVYQLSRLDVLPSNLLAHCCSFLPFHVKAALLIRLNRRTQHELQQSSACYREDAVHYSVDVRYDAALIASANRSMNPNDDEPVPVIVTQALQQWLRCQQSINYLPRVRSISATYRMNQSMKELTHYTINQFYTSMMNLRSALTGPTLKSLLLHECDSQGSLKQGVTEWLFEQLVQCNPSIATINPSVSPIVNQPIKLENLTLKLYSSHKRRSSSHVFNPSSWKWSALSIMTSLKSLHLIGRLCVLPCQQIIDSLPQSITHLQIQHDLTQNACEWNNAFKSTTFLPMLEHLEINQVDDALIAEALATTVMKSTNSVRPVNTLVLSSDYSVDNRDTFMKLAAFRWTLPVVLKLDVSLEQFHQSLLPLLTNKQSTDQSVYQSIPLLKSFILCITAPFNHEPLDLTQLLVSLSKREIYHLTIDVAGRSIASFNQDATIALTQLTMLKSLTITSRHLDFTAPHSINQSINQSTKVSLFDSSVDLNQLITPRCWPHLTYLNVSNVLPHSVDDMNVLIAGLPSLLSIDVSHMKSPLLCVAAIATHCRNVAQIDCWNDTNQYECVSLTQLESSFAHQTNQSTKQSVNQSINHPTSFQYLRSLRVGSSQVDADAMNCLRYTLGYRLKCAASTVMIDWLTGCSGSI